MSVKTKNSNTSLQPKHRSMGKYIIFSVTLFLFICAIGSAAFLSSMQYIIRVNKGNELTKLLELERTKLKVLVDKEIADVLKMANSPQIRRFFENPADKSYKDAAMNEIDTYRFATAGSIFWINDTDKMFHYEDRQAYFVNPIVPENDWYQKTLNEQEMYNFSVNYNSNLDMAKLWINAPIFDRTRKISMGVIGSGVDISQLIDTVYSAYSQRYANMGFYLFNAEQEIIGAKDASLIAQKKSIKDELGYIGQSVADTAKNLLPGEVRTFAAEIGQVAVISIPMETYEWYAVAVLPNSLDDFKTPMTILFLSVVLIIAFILTLSNVFVAKLIKPLQEMTISLQAASKAKSNFLATMSHEIRTPMNAIIGIAQIELQNDNLTDEVATAFGKIYDSGNSLLGIINDILDMSKIETGKLELNPVDYDTPSLINDTVQLNIVRIGSKQIEFTLDVDENLPSRLFGDDLRIKQVLNNLLSNAIKYTASGSVKLSVSHIASGGDVTLRFAVADTGQGMKPEDLKRLFSEYTRFNASANRTTEGTGIGLNITQNLVNMMDGTIKVDSVYGKGSTFEVTLKQKAVDCPVIGKELVEQLRSFKFSGKKQYANLQISRELMPYGKVLVVDDVDSNLYVAKGLMSPYKLSVETALSGFETIDKVKAGSSYDVIFMDHMMPEMDGIETTQKLRESGYKGVIVALTANAIVGNEDMFLSNGFDDFVSKPIDVRHLNTVLNKFVRDRHPEEAKKYKSANAQPSAPAADISQSMDPKLLEIVCRDAEKAIATLRKTMESGDIKLFTTTAHAMKSALANIGEKEMSASAFALENAGRNGDREFIAANSNKFIDSLLSLIERLSPTRDETDDEADTDTTEDIEYLIEQLSTVKTACENYDDTAAYATLDLLKEKLWKKETCVALEEIRDALFLHSDFDDAVERIDKMKVQRG
ncbi:MAG: response regulator [Chitinispirillales bacterium]|jgi:signal transduction histidine kinase/DNA-binding response OmpR family regulator|nr:response regulator [Chitinispirillales bacterium]